MLDLEYRVVIMEPLIVALPSDHSLASQDAITLQDVAGETFIRIFNTAPTLRVIDEARGGPLSHNSGAALIARTIPRVKAFRLRGLLSVIRLIPASILIRTSANSRAERLSGRDGCC
jgi:DNA-binding transcriptional LysR family regulator